MESRNLNLHQKTTTMQDQNRYLAPKFEKCSPYEYWIPTAPLDPFNSVYRTPCLHWAAQSMLRRVQPARGATRRTLRQSRAAANAIPRSTSKFAPRTHAHKAREISCSSIAIVPFSSVSNQGLWIDHQHHGLTHTLAIWRNFFVPFDISWQMKMAPHQRPHKEPLVEQDQKLNTWHM